MGETHEHFHPAAKDGTPSFLAEGGEMGALMRAHDWAVTSFGPLETWPQSLRSALSICLNSAFPIAIYWGPELRVLYNDAWAPIPGPRHPWALGRPAREVWSDIWDVIEPQFARVFAGEGFSTANQLLPMKRYGVVEETYWNYSFTPIRGEDGSVVGVFNSGNETTTTVFAERRLATMVDLADRLRDLSDPDTVMRIAAGVVGEHMAATRVGYAEIDEAGGWATNGPDWTAPSVASIAGEHRLTDFGEAFVSELKRGRTAVIHDVAADPRTALDRGAFAALSVAAFIVVPIIKASRFAAAFFVHAAEPRRWSNAEMQLVKEAAERTWNAVERARAEIAMGESEARFRAMANSIPQLAWMADGDGHIFWYNQRWYDYTGTTLEAMQGWGWREVHHPEHIDRVIAEVQGNWAAGQAWEGTYLLRSADGEYRWFLTRAEPIQDEAGRVVRWFGTNTDITEQRETARVLAETAEAKEALLYEVNHRVKNSLAVVTSLLTLQAGQAKDPALKQALGNARGRVGVVAKLHQRLYSTHQHNRVDLGSFLAEIAHDLAGALDTEERITLNVKCKDEVVLGIDKAVPLALLVSELLTNAAKYAFPDDREGTVSLSLTRMDDDLRIVVADDGQGLPEGFDAARSKGVGMRIINALCRQLRAQLIVSSQEPGTRFEIVLPKENQHHEPIKASSPDQ